MAKTAKSSKRAAKTGAKSTYKVAEAKARFSELLARVENGEEVIIARGDQPVARLVSINERARRRAVIEAIRAERGRGLLAPTTMDEILAWRHEGHRY